MELIYKILIVLLIPTGTFYISQYLIKKVLGKILTDIEKLGGKKQVAAIRAREDKLGYITTTVSIIEYLFFGALSFWFALDGSLTNPEIGILFKFFVGWLAIKMVPSYKMWSDPKVGKAYFYRSLFGTMISIVFAVVSGIVIALISSIF